MSFSNYLETKVLDHVFGATAYTAPATLYVALFTTAPGEAGGGTEISGSGYARQSVAFTTTGDTTSNTAAVEFPTASGSWGTISYAAVYDALTSGNQMCYATLASAKTIASGDVFRIPTGDLDITLD
tara:strand:- start:1176 stop:1556 length:381 start_codon:yes stop_codon:yes gene_type:complete